MSRVLERERARVPVPVRYRSRVLESTLIIVGALVALAGLYFQGAPSDWWLAHFSEGYQYGAYALGGLILGAGFGVYADRTYEEDGGPSARMVTGVTLAILAVVGALLALVLWII
jgi:hypothetical protein